MTRFLRWMRQPRFTGWHAAAWVLAWLIADDIWRRL